MNRSNKIFNIFKLSKNKKKDIYIEKLKFNEYDLNPVMSPDTIKYHYGKLAKGYAQRYNDGIGDSDFNEAGVFLHNIFFSQLCSPKRTNKPSGAVLKIIEDNFNSFDNFKEVFKKEAMKIQGSGWIYLSKDGSIKVINNHKIKKDIAFLIDWWEHAWALDYQHDKESYLDNMWRIINWELINNRIY
jgi:Fe-Mn family superoxide dismutase